MNVDWIDPKKRKPEKETWYAVTVTGIFAPRISSAYWDGKHFNKGGIEMDTFIHAWADGLEAYKGGNNGAYPTDCDWN